MKRIVPISLCLVTILMVTGCSRLFPKRMPKVRTLALREVSDEGVKLARRFSADGVAVNMDYDHPHEFSEETIRNEIDSLVVRQYTGDKSPGTNQWVREPAFTSAGEERLASALVVAFKEASRSDKILFSLPGRTGQPTLGEVYLQDDKLVWIFKEIDGRTFLGPDPFTLDGGDWTIEERPGLSVQNKKHVGVIKVVHHLRGGEPETVAEITEKRLLQPLKAPSKGAREETAVTAGEVMSPSPDERRQGKLHALKKWQEAGLITDEDYEKEKAKILQQGQQL